MHDQTNECSECWTKKKNLAGNTQKSKSWSYVNSAHINNFQNVQNFESENFFIQIAEFSRMFFAVKNVQIFDLFWIESYWIALNNNIVYIQ